jgi:hypothetical protein
VEQNRGLGYEYTAMLTLFLTKASKTYDGEKDRLQKMLLGKVAICCRKL